MSQSGLCGAQFSLPAGPFHQDSFAAASTDQCLDGLQQIMQLPRKRVVQLARGSSADGLRGELI